MSLGFDRFDLTNWRQHPTQPQYQIFFFKKVEEGKYFEQLLVEHSVKFEISIDEEERGKKKVMIGIHRNDMEKAKELNHLALGEFRKPFLANAIFRYALLVFVSGVISLAIIGYFFSK